MHGMILIGIMRNWKAVTMVIDRNTINFKEDKVGARTHWLTKIQCWQGIKTDSRKGKDRGCLSRWEGSLKMPFSCAVTMKISNKDEGWNIRNSGSISWKKLVIKHLGNSEELILGDNYEFNRTLQFGGINNAVCFTSIFNELKSCLPPWRLVSLQDAEIFWAIEMWQLFTHLKMGYYGTKNPGIVSFCVCLKEKNR